MNIQELIQLKGMELGLKIMELLKTQDGISRLVNAIDDHLAESMKDAYHTGLIEGIENRQKVLLTK